MHLLLIALFAVCVGAEMRVHMRMPEKGVRCVWGEWSEREVAGWKLEGDEPHHLILYATTSPQTVGCPREPRDREFVYIWGGEGVFRYGEETVRKFRPGTRFYLESHNHAETPLSFTLTSISSTVMPRWQALIAGSAVSRGRVEEGGVGVFVSPACRVPGEPVRLRMHSHRPARHQLLIGDSVVLDTKKGHHVNYWYDGAQADTVFHARCTFEGEMAIGHTYCRDCEREMCDAYVQFRVPYAETVDARGLVCA